MKIAQQDRPSGKDPLYVKLFIHSKRIQLSLSFTDSYISSNYRLWAFRTYRFNIIWPTVYGDIIR